VVVVVPEDELLDESSFFGTGNDGGCRKTRNQKFL
jgi:hypothetical protein